MDQTDFFFFLTLENVFSDAGITDCVAPQGSISIPLLFLVYITDLPQSLNKSLSYPMLTILLSFIKIRMLKEKKKF